jgi:hypothetical protein
MAVRKAALEEGKGLILKYHEAVAASTLAAAGSGGKSLVNVPESEKRVLAKRVTCGGCEGMYFLFLNSSLSFSF